MALLCGRTPGNDERTRGVVIFRAESEAAGPRIMLEDSAIADGIMRAELYLSRVALLGRDR